MAEAIFKHKVQSMGYSKYFKLIDSYGTSNYHIGDDADSRSIKTCKKHGIIIDHTGQQIQRSDYNKFDYIIGMDSSNKSDLVYRKPSDYKGVIDIFGKWRTDTSFDKIVSDPYYGGINGFETNFKQLCHFSEQFLLQEIGPLD